MGDWASYGRTLAAGSSDQAKKSWRSVGKCILKVLNRIHEYEADYIYKSSDLTRLFKLEYAILESGIKSILHHVNPAAQICDREQLLLEFAQVNWLNIEKMWFMKPIRIKPQ